MLEVFPGFRPQSPPFFGAFNIVVNHLKCLNVYVKLYTIVHSYLY